MEEVDKGCLTTRMGVSGKCFFWYQPTWVVPDKGPLNGCVCSSVTVSGCFVRVSCLMAWMTMSRNMIPSRLCPNAVFVVW